MRHVMVDIETLGTRPGAVILSIGACRFDETGIGERFYRPIDVFDSLMTGLKADDATIGFWRMQSAEARGALAPGRPLRETLDAFVAFVKQPDSEVAPHHLIWAKGPDSDLVLLEAAYCAIDQKKPWSYRVARDVRTILALAPGADSHMVNVGAHHALNDAVFQAHNVIAAAEKLGVALSEMV